MKILENKMILNAIFFVLGIQVSFLHFVLSVKKSINVVKKVEQMHRK